MSATEQPTLTVDQMRLLILVSRFSKPSAKANMDERWIKNLPLMALLNRGIRFKVFKTYDYSPSLVEYMGIMRFANISKEGEDDIGDLREVGLIERLKLATSHHVYVSAYRVTLEGEKLAPKLADEHHKAVDRIVNCKGCGGIVDIEARGDGPFLVCKKCRTEELEDIFDIEDVAYVSSPYFADIWLPPS